MLRTAGELKIAFSTGHVQTIWLRGEVGDCSIVFPGTFFIVCTHTQSKSCLISIFVPAQTSHLKALSQLFVLFGIRGRGGGESHGKPARS